MKLTKTFYYQFGSEFTPIASVPNPETPPANFLSPSGEYTYGSPPVTGVMTNLNTKSSQANGLSDPYTSTGSGLTYIDNISNIGSDWKNFIMPGGPWVIEDSLAYFILTQDDKIWRLIFTGFGGSSTGMIYFNKSLLYDPTSIVKMNKNITTAAIYPIPAQQNSSIVYNF